MVNYGSQNSDLTKIVVKEYEITPNTDTNAIGGYSYGFSLKQMGEIPSGTQLIIPIACGQKTNWNNNGIISIHQNDFVRISANTKSVYSVRIAFLKSNV